MRGRENKEIGGEWEGRGEGKGGGGGERRRREESGRRYMNTVPRF